MTLVTTSRRSTPVIRSIAKDLAFATGARYLARGKHGLREIAEEDDIFIIIEQQKSDNLITLYDEGVPSQRRIIKKHESGIREGAFVRGIKTSDKALGSLLENSSPVQYIDDERLILIFDGPQKRCMKLTLIPVVT